MEPSPKQTIIFFDIDDTLFNSSEFRIIVRKESLKALNLSLKRFNINYTDQYLYEQFEQVYQQDKNSNKMFDNLLLKLKIPEHQISLHVAIAKETWDITKHEMQAFENVKEILTYLKEKGYTLAIASAGLGVKQWDKLVRTKLHEFFNPKYVFMTSEINGERRKYSKDKLFYKQIRNSYPNEDFKTFYMIGDIIKQDILPSNNAGFKTFLYNPTKLSEEEKTLLKQTNTKTFNNYNELKQYF